MFPKSWKYGLDDRADTNSYLVAWHPHYTAPRIIEYHTTTIGDGYWKFTGHHVCSAVPAEEFPDIVWFEIPCYKEPVGD